MLGCLVMVTNTKSDGLRPRPPRRMVVTSVRGRRRAIERWGFEVELIVAARCRGYRVKELPIKWRNNFASTVPATAYLQVLGEVWRVRKQRSAGRYG